MPTCPICGGSYETREEAMDCMRECDRKDFDED